MEKKNLVNNSPIAKRFLNNIIIDLWNQPRVVELPRLLIIKL